MDILWGRKVMLTELQNQKIVNNQDVQVLSTMKVIGHHIKCLRCGQIHKQESAILPNGKYYCRQCIQLGRVCSGEHFFHVKEPRPVIRAVDFQWFGQLSVGQHEISTQLVELVKNKKSSIIWAVTGAGKTEMLFEMIYDRLKKGFRIGLASPRVDVCLELFPRIQSAFPKEEIMLLHGQMKEPYRYTKLVICTTHQLLRFYQAFDVLIIDEVDAFPFVNQPFLQYGVSQAVKKNSAIIYLTATPTKALQEKVHLGELRLLSLPARYHRRALPVPKTYWCSNWEKQIMQDQFPKKLLIHLTRLLQDTTVLIFCPSISLVKKVAFCLEKKLPNEQIECVHAADEYRKEKVLKMRAKKYSILVTSTILERGVTFSNVSVLVLGANHTTFNTAALVQISGRVDRVADKSKGQVYFIHDGLNREIKQAIREIKDMNRQAKKRALIDDL